MVAHRTLARISTHDDEERWAERAEAEAKAAIDVFAACNDEGGLALAWRTLAFVAWYRGDIGNAETGADARGQSRGASGHFIYPYAIVFSC